MGSNQPSLPKSNWTYLDRNERHQIYQNQFGILAEKHVLLNDPRLNEEEEISAYLYRCNSNKPIVKAYRADYETSSDICSHHKNILVFIEYIPFRLIETRDLTHEQGLYVLSQSLLGFHELYCHLGAFQIDDTLIGFNKDGQVRVWMNTNFAKNHFQAQNLVLMSTVNPLGFDQRTLLQQQKDMVLQIWDAVESHVRFNLQFRNHIKTLQQLNFYNLKEIVDDEIRNLPYVPPRLKFEDRNGILQRSNTAILQPSQHSRGSVRNNNLNSGNWT